MTSAPRPSRGWNSLLLLLLAVAAALRFWQLGRMEFWWDEFVTIGRSLPDIPDLLRGLMYQSPNVATDCSPPLHHLLVHAALAVGRSAWVVKAPSALCGLLSIAFVFLIGQRLFGRRAGFLAALFCSLSVFHIYYSRDIRWYSTFYACSLGGLHFLLLAMESGRWKHWLCFGLFTALSFYASYMAAMFAAGEAAFVLWAAFARSRRGGGGRALLLRAGAALALAALLYAPWIPAQYYAYLSFKGKGERVPFEWGFFASTFRFYLEYFYQGGFNRLWIAAPLCLAGLGAGLASRRLRPGVAAVSCWALTPIVGVYTVKTEFGVSPKYVMSLFYFFAFSLALGLDALAGRLDAALRARKGLPGWGLALGLLAVAGAANFKYPTFYKGVMYSDKTLMRDVALRAAPGDHLFYETPRSLSFLGHWRLGEAFPTARGVLGRGYKRALFVSGDCRNLPGHVPAVRRTGFCVDRFGVVNASPLQMVPDADGLYAYHEPYQDLGLFSQAYETGNATVDLAYGGLSPADTTRPGRVLYAFAVPPGVQVDKASLALQATVVRRNLPDIDGYVDVLAGTARDRLTPAGRLDVSDAPEAMRQPGFRGLYTLDKTFDLPAPPPGGGTLFVELRFSIGTRDGSFTVTALDLRASCRGQPPSDAAVARAATDTLLDNLGEAAPAPSTAQAGPAPGRLAAFTLDEAVLPPQGPVGGVDRRAAFLAAHPRARLVWTARLPDATAYLELYDPWLDEPLQLAAGERITLPPGQPLGGLRAPGSAAPAFLDVGGTVIPLSMGLPPSASVLLNPGGRGAMILRPVFDSEHFSPRDIDSLRGVRVKPQDNALTCLGVEPCFASWRFKSFHPVTRVVVTAYPRILNDASRGNSLRMALCADGGPCRELLGVESTGSGGWTGPDVHEVRELVLDKPARDVTLRLEMANESCLWTSSPDQPMTFELFFDVPRLPRDGAGPLELVNVSPEGGGARFEFSPGSFQAWEALRPGLALPASGRPVP